MTPKQFNEYQRQADKFRTAVKYLHEASKKRQLEPTDFSIAFELERQHLTDCYLAGSYSEHSKLDAKDYIKQNYEQ